MIKLRELVESDSDKIAELINNRKICDQLCDIIPFPYDINDAKNFIQFSKEDSTKHPYGIEFNSNLVGIVSLEIQSDIHRLSAELGYWLGEAYWGKGIMPQAVRKIIEIGFNKYNILRIYSNVKEHNKQSQRVLDKTGFTLESISKKAIIKNGIIQDEYRYYIINENFEMESTKDDIHPNK